MTLSTWWLFVTAVFLLSATPGPNMLHVLTRSVRFGARRAVASMAGCLVAVVVVLTASAAGLGAVLAASPVLFDVIRYAGAAYLLYLGIKAWRGGEASAAIGDDAPSARSGRALFRDGLKIGLSNPKLLLFATAFLSQFVDPAAPQVPQLVILIATFAGIDTFWYAVYALGGRTLARGLTRPALKRAFDRVTGGIFVGFGIALFAART